MPYDTFNPAWIPKYGAAVKRTPRLHIAQFGDGYSQASEDGINFNIEQWSLAWETDEATATTIEEWLAAHAATPFKWTSPKGVLIQVTCRDEVGHSWDNYGNHTVTATFKQDFSPEL